MRKAQDDKKFMVEQEDLEYRRVPTERGGRYPHCKGCGQEVSALAKTCHKCGRGVNGQIVPKQQRIQDTARRHSRLCGKAHPGRYLCCALKEDLVDVPDSRLRLEGPCPAGRMCSYLHNPNDNRHLKSNSEYIIGWNVKELDRCKFLPSKYEDWYEAQGEERRVMIVALFKCGFINNEDDIAHFHGVLDKQMIEHGRYTLFDKGELCDKDRFSEVRGNKLELALREEAALREAVILKNATDLDAYQKALSEPQTLRPSPKPKPKQRMGGVDLSAKLEMSVTNQLIARLPTGQNEQARIQRLQVARIEQTHEVEHLQRELASEMKNLKETQVAHSLNVGVLRRREEDSEQAVKQAMKQVDTIRQKLDGVQTRKNDVDRVLEREANNPWGRLP